MPPRVVRPREDMDYMGIIFAEGTDGENQRSRYHKIFKRDVLATRYPDNGALRDLDLSDSVHWMLNNLGLKATTIQNPTIRYLHCILANTIFGRDNTVNVNSKDLFLIYYALSRTKVNPTPFLLTHFQSTCVRTGGLIYVGGLITSITLALNLGMELATLEPLEIPFANLDYCRSMRLIKNKPDSKYSLMISNREVMGVNLPCVVRINMHMSAKWTFDLDAPEPDHMEQDAPHTGTQAHIAPVFLDSFAGTSSGHQPREEYDYIAMKATLDDILSELRHRSDADADCDVLLRNI
ncbi:hypothetical protein KIW84_040187 [Lathyrus oleraceus]|uniref:Arabidopsis retrotransposon Orf1 C-terminal domain-containing protein n=1 Tax=Pisum sativum TaxID=3888 RepID=A0A9D5AQH5_PEA|nr:hypothetical protein KIW84_040187 [Pisum sativum]